MMKKHKLVRKIFIAIVSIFVIVLLIQLVVQNYLLQDWYYYAKHNQMEKKFTAFTEKLREERQDLNDFSVAAKEFSHQNNQPTLLFYENGEILNQGYFDQFSSIKIKVDHKVYLVNMDNFADEESRFVQGLWAMNVGSEIEATLVKVPGIEVYEPVEINNVSGHQLGTYYGDVNGDEVTGVKGIISEISIVQRPEGIGRYQGSKLLGEMHHLLDGFIKDKLLSTNEVYSYNFVEEYSGLYMAVYLAEVNYNGEQIYCLSLITLENIEDTFDVLSGYYFYMFLIQLGLAMGLSVAFIRWISKPIIEITEVAASIANHDFTHKTTIQTQDELQTLSENMNRISENLSTTFKELEVTNHKLSSEVKKSTENETRMRHMLSGLSHEFKTPLGIISGFTEIIKADVGDKEPAYYLNSIEEEVDRLNEMVMETLELTKLETGIYKMNQEAFDISEVIDSVIKTHQTAAKSKNQKLEYVHNEVYVLGDRRKIGQVLSNLITNGIGYSPESEKIIINVTPHSGCIKIRVMNSGVQIDKEDLKHIWNRFYRGEKSRNKALGGHGLGLAIVYNILKLHDSRFGIENIDNGVEVFFTLKGADNSV